MLLVSGQQIFPRSIKNETTCLANTYKARLHKNHSKQLVEVFVSHCYIPSTGKFHPALVRSEVLTVVKVPMLVYWVVTPCGTVSRYAEDGGNMSLQNVGIYV